MTSGHIQDYDTKGVCEAALRVGTDDMDLSTDDTESAKTSSETFSGPTKSRLDLLGAEGGNRSEIDEDVVNIRAIISNNLQSIKDVINQAIGLGNQVTSSRNLISQATLTNDGTR